MNMLMLLLGSRLAENQGVVDRGRQIQIGAIAAAMPSTMMGFVMAKVMADRDAPVEGDDDRAPVDLAIAELEARKQILDEEDRALAQQQTLVEAQLKALKASTSTSAPPAPAPPPQPSSGPTSSGTAVIAPPGAMKK